jgi:hypothetical protein
MKAPSDWSDITISEIYPRTAKKFTVLANARRERKALIAEIEAPH